MKTKNSTWKVVLIAIAIIIAVALMAVFGVQSYMNRAISMEEQVSTAKSDVNVQEKRRVDLLGNLVDCVNNYDKHEYETLKAIVDGRSSNDDKATEIKTSIKAVSEAYPELKSNENYKQLMNELATTENLITNYRENYNKQVKIYNAYVRKFPQRMFLDFLGYEKQLLESRERCIAFISYYLTEIGENEGHTWCSVDILKAAVEDSAPECIDVFDGVLENNSFLHQYENRIGLKLYYNLEMKILSIIQERLNKPSPVPIENDEIEAGIAKAEQEQGFSYTDEQKAIIRSILTQSISFVTGKAGTGKSSILRGIIRAYSLANHNISACALSAMAAQRITEATDYPAMTIHRTLGCHGPNKFDYNKNCKLISPVVLMDEASMVNVQIFLAWLEAIGDNTKIIICGDYKQLPPIGFGNIFSDLIHCLPKENINELTKVMRQAEKSGILTDANLIRDNKNPITEVITSKKLVHGELQDMYYMFRDTRDSLHQLALKMFFSAVESDGVDNVGIAVPRREGCLNSAYELNKDIAEVLLKDEKKSISFGEKEFKLGCKVVQTVNDYDRNVFNGEIGYITFIGEDMSGKKPVTYCEVTYQSFGPKVEKDVGLVFDEDNNIVYEKQDKVIRYEGSELTDLDMAYALTTHKMQGSSRKTVICVIDNTHYKLLDNCMLYTMLTRAKKRCLLCAEPQAFYKCLNTSNNARNTWLSTIKRKGK